jgi:endoglycosylceramidase
MSFHDYCLSGNAAASCSKGEQGAISNALKRSRATGDAALLTEFGAVSDTSVLQRVEHEADAQRMPWIEWAYCGCADPTGSIPPSKEAVVLDPSKPPTGSNVVASTLAPLVRPYPKAVAGTPTKFAFDTGSSRFSLTYSTRKPSGRGAFKAGSCTQVFVPALHYPHGYRARVRGARVISSRGGGILELASRRGAKRVSLTVTPAKHGHTGPPKITPQCR